jgi:hypothetical protein
VFFPIVLCCHTGEREQKYLKNVESFHVVYLEGKHARNSLIYLKSHLLGKSLYNVLLCAIILALILVHLITLLASICLKAPLKILYVLWV